MRKCIWAAVFALAFSSVPASAQDEAGEGPPGPAPRKIAKKLLKSLRADGNQEGAETLQELVHALRDRSHHRAVRMADMKKKHIHGKSDDLRQRAKRIRKRAERRIKGWHMEIAELQKKIEKRRANSDKNAMEFEEKAMALEEKANDMPEPEPPASEDMD